jgi:formylglycine-generating enzyme required for sulfatase activity
MRLTMTASPAPPRALPDIDWVEIPGGDYIYQEGTSRSLPTFYMARHPVTNVCYQAFIDAGGYDDECWWQGIERPKPQESRWPQATRPCTSVNWYEAVAFSRWLSEQLGYSVRLPTEEEWERAARGRDGRAFPWATLTARATPTSMRPGTTPVSANSNRRRSSARIRRAPRAKAFSTWPATSANGVSTNTSIRRTSSPMPLATPNGFCSSAACC